MVMQADNPFMVFALQFCEHVNTPVSLGVYLRLKSGIINDLPDVKPGDYLSTRGRLPWVLSRRYFLDKQCEAFIAKSDLPSSIDPKEAAFRSFVQSESECSKTNDLFRLFRENKVSLLGLSWSVVSRLQSTIANVLGDLDIPALCLAGGFGPGSDFDTVRAQCSVYDKTINLGSVSPLCSQYLRFLPERLFLCSTFSEWSLDTRLPVGLKRSESNRHALVPKSLKTDRNISIEPRWNIFIQKGVGAHLRKRLLRVGIDLNDQSRNQLLAQIGSLDDSYSTIDLERASDCLSREVVSLLLPIDWYVFLDNIRTHKTNGCATEKFSSMGNGFTFELESLIFYAIIHVCGSFSGSVYGDDIIVERALAPRVMSVLRALGFTPNQSKTFIAGPFKESCGEDFIYGERVRPVYFRKWRDHRHLQLNRIFDLIDAFNGDGLFLCEHLLDLHSRLINGECKSFRHSQGVWSWYPIDTPIVASNGFEGRRQWVYRPVVKGFRPRDYDSAIVQAMLAPFTDVIVPRRSPRYVRKRVFIPEISRVRKLSY